MSKDLVGKYITLAPQGEVQQVYFVTDFYKRDSQVRVLDISCSMKTHFHVYLKAVDKILPQPPAYTKGQELSAYVDGKLMQGFTREVTYCVDQYVYVLQTLSGNYISVWESNLCLPCRSMFATRARTYISSGVYGDKA